MSSSNTIASTRLNLNQQIAAEINARTEQVKAAVELLDGGATVPFIARYRKELTGGLSDAQLRQLDERLAYLRELDDRRASIVKMIEELGALDKVLHQQLLNAATKAELEDLYLPYRKKRRTKGQIAIEAGLQPLADQLWSQAQTSPEQAALAYISEDRGVADVKAALDGARAILMERFAEDATLIARLRSLMQDKAYLCTQLNKGKADEGEKFQDYFDHQELYSKVPGHRALAMFRGRSAGILGLKLLLREADGYGDQGCIDVVAAHHGFTDTQQPADAWRAQVISWTWRVKLSLHLESEFLQALRTRADAQAIDVFAANMRDLLLAAPAGPRATIGLDPGFRTGVKVAVIDATGKVLDHCAIFPHPPQRQWAAAIDRLTSLCSKYNVELIAIGNGTASRETEKLAAECLHKAGLAGVTPVIVSEAGASVYSASEIAEREFPDLDVTIRGAISIARRLQDPLAELVKIDPKAVGVGQYQHDVSQTLLGKSLEATVEDCVNAVGVDLTTASAALLSRVAGLSATLANNIVAYRDEQGVISTRAELKKVPRLGRRRLNRLLVFCVFRRGAIHLMPRVYIRSLIRWSSELSAMPVGHWMS